ncbi:uncharacterized protein LOC123693511 [Colias croceus]|uniref:uncharacterized protein LOC123693511 n=1 Tax=Colias crocea TaxID=72248 RepID=UPI001E280C80|nr:uncharacterized protein LOC123693511 [Colias croceus]
MLKLLGAFFFIFICCEVCQAWNQRACFVNRLGYIEKVLQETMYEVEKNVKFCNLRVNDFNYTLNDRMYSFHVSGLAQFKNSFLISIERMDVNAISSVVGRRHVAATNVTEYEALVRATINLRVPRVGFDVIIDVEGTGPQHYTAVFQFDSITIPILILKKINTNETVVSTTSAGQSSRHQRMQFVPNTNVSQVLSRHIHGYHMDDSFTTWARDIIVPIMQKLIDTKLGFPEIRFDGC